MNKYLLHCISLSKNGCNLIYVIFLTAYVVSIDVIRKKRIDIHFFHSNYLSSLGMIYKCSGKFYDAETKFRQVWELYTSYLQNRHDIDPMRGTLLTYWGDVLAKTGRPVEAEEKYALAWKYFFEILSARKDMDSHRASLLTNWVYLLMQCDHINEAKVKYQQAMNFYNEPLINHRKLIKTRISLQAYFASCLAQSGRLSEAEDIFKEAWDYLISSVTGINLDENKALLLNDWGLTLFHGGQINEAEAKFQLGIDYYNGVLIKRRDLDIHRVSLLSNFAILLIQCNRYSEAEDKYRKVWDILVSHEETTGNHHEYQQFILRDWGTLLFLSGRLEEAEAKLQMASEINPQTIENIENIARQVLLLISLGAVLYQNGRFDKSEDIFRKAWKLYSRETVDSDPMLALVFGNLLGNWGLLLCKISRFEEAEEKYKQAWELFNSSSSGYLNVDSEKIRLLSNHGILLCRNGRFKEAEEKFQEAEEKYHQFMAIRPNMVRDYALLLIGWGATYHAMGKGKEAQLKYQDAYQIYTNQLRNQPHLYPEVCLLFFKWLQTYSDDADSDIYIDWAVASSLEMARMLELSAWNKLSYGESQVINYYVIFHFLWLTMCLCNKDYHVFPRILSAIQSRKLARLILDEIDRSELSFEMPEQVREFKRLRLKLRQIIANMKVISNQQIGDGGSGVLRYAPGNVELVTPLQTEISQRKMDALTEEYQQTLEDYVTKRDELTQLEGYELLTAPYQAIGADTIKGRLTNGQALLMLVDLAVIENRIDYNQIDTNLEGYEHIDVRFGWLLFPEGSPQLIEEVNDLPLDDLMQQLQAKDLLKSGTQSLILRKGPSSESDISIEFNGWDWYAEQMRTYLWQPLEVHLTDVKELIVITHGRFHQLPLSLGLNLNLAVRHYPGLPFFIHDNPKQQASSQFCREHASVSYSGDDLLFASHEGSLLKKYLWDKEEHHGEPLDALPEQQGTGKRPLESLYFSCHGDVNMEQPEFTHLNLGHENLITFHEILRMPYLPKSVFIGACVAGQTHEDRDGDPLGPVTAFFLRGAEVVIACLTPVPDLYMPLLSYLTEATALKFGLPLDQALAQAKLRLTDWQSQPTYADLVNGYKEWLVTCLTPWLDDRWRVCGINGEDIEQQKDFLRNDFLSLSLPSEKESPVHRISVKTFLVSIGATLEQINTIEQHVGYIADSMTGLSESDKERCYQPIFNVLLPYLMMPPPDVIELLTHSVRAFGKGSIIYH